MFLQFIFLKLYVIISMMQLQFINCYSNDEVIVVKCRGEEYKCEEKKELLIFLEHTFVSILSILNKYEKFQIVLNYLP